MSRSNEPNAAIFLVQMAIVLTMSLLLFEGPGGQATAPIDPALHEAMQRAMEMSVFVAEMVVYMTTAVVAVVVLANILPAAYRFVKRRKQYPIRTFAVLEGRPFVERHRENAIDCVNCTLDDEPGHTIRYGRETILAGFSLRRATEGANEECLTCAVADPIDAALRAEYDRPESIVDELDLEPDEAHEAVDELEAVEVGS